MQYQGQPDWKASVDISDAVQIRQQTSLIVWVYLKL